MINHTNGRMLKISRAMECHLPYGITQCYLPPDTSEHTPP